VDGNFKDVVTLGLSLTAVAVSGIALWRTIRNERLKPAHSVSLYRTRAFGVIDEANHDEIIVRNDGDHAVTLNMVGMAYGNVFSHDRHSVETWATIDLPLGREDRLLVPAGQLVLPAPQDPTNVGILGPIVEFVDSTGRTWEKSMYATRQVRRSKARKPRRRDAWFEKRSWFKRLDGGLERRAIDYQRKRPGAWPALPLLIDIVWGWRAGRSDNGRQPLNAPLGWRYAVVVDRRRDVPDTTLRYPWRNAGGGLYDETISDDDSVD
jgi:hypothetical protein